jgi:hypothetical protein
LVEVVLKGILAEPGLWLVFGGRLGVADRVRERFGQATGSWDESGLEGDECGTYFLGIRRAREKPVSGWVDGKGTGGNEGAEKAAFILAVLRRKIPLLGGSSRDVFVYAFELRTMERSMKSGIDDGWQRPSGTVSAEAAGHGAAITKKECVRGL